MSLARLSLARLRRSIPAWICLSTLATGCASIKEQAPSLTGSFTNGGGQYGQPAPEANKPTATENVSLLGLFSGKPAQPKVGSKTTLAYAQWEERQGQYAMARNQPEEHRAHAANARKTYEQVLAEDSKSIEAVIGLARLDQVAGRAGEAEQGFLKALRMENNSPRTLDALGQFYAAQKRWNDALPTLQRAAAGAPEDQAIQYHYAITLAQSGQIKEAEPLLVKSVGKASAHYNIGVILHEQGDLIGSEERFVAAILENPRLEEAQHWLQEIRRDRQKASPQVAQQSFKVSTLKPAPQGQPPITAGHSAPSVTPAGAHAENAAPVPPQGRPGVIQQVSATTTEDVPRLLPTLQGKSPASAPAASGAADSPSDQWDALR